MLAGVCRRGFEALISTVLGGLDNEDRSIHFGTRRQQVICGRSSRDLSPDVLVARLGW